MYREPSELSREEKIEAIRGIRNPMYQRVRGMRDNPKYSQVGVEAYDRQMEFLKSHFSWFNPTGNMPKIDTATDNELDITLSRLMYTDTRQTMNKLGAKSYQQVGEYLFKGYNKLTRSEQSALWRLGDRLKEENPDLDSDTVYVLIKRTLNGGDVFFGKDDNGITQVTSIVTKDGAIYSADPKAGEYNLYDIIDGLEASYTEHISWRRFNEESQEFRAKVSKQRKSRTR